MASAEIVAKLGLESSSFSTGIAKAGTEVASFEKRLERFGLNFNPGEKFARESARVFEQIGAAERQLASATAARNAENNAGFSRQILLQREILTLKTNIDRMEGNSLEKVQAKIVLQQKLLELERNIANESARAARESQRSAAGASGGGAAEAAAGGAAPKGPFSNLLKGFSIGNVIKGAAAGLGFASVQAIADRIVEPFKKASESAKELEEISGRVAAANIEAARSRLTEEQRYQLALGERAALEQRIAGAAVTTDEQRLALKQDELRLAELVTQTTAYQLKQEQARAAAGEASYQRHLAALDEERKASYDGLSTAQRVLALRDQIYVTEKAITSGYLEQKNAAELQLSVDKMRSELLDSERALRKEFGLSDAQRAELNLLEFKGRSRLTEQERIRLEVLKLQAKVMANNLEIATISAKPIKEVTDADRKRVAALTAQNEVIGQQIGKFNELANGAGKVKGAADGITEALEAGLQKLTSYADQWKEFIVSVTNIGRGNKELSDRDLARKEAALRADIAAREAQLTTRNVGVGIDPNYDPFLATQRYNLGQLMEEQRVREQTRRNVAFFGEEQAFKMFGGTEQRFMDILRGLTEQQDTARRAADGIEKLNRLFLSGQAVTRTIPTS